MTLSFLVAQTVQRLSGGTLTALRRAASGPSAAILSWFILLWLASRGVGSLDSAEFIASPAQLLPGAHLRGGIQSEATARDVTISLGTSEHDDLRRNAWLSSEWSRT